MRKKRLIHTHSMPHRRSLEQLYVPRPSMKYNVKTLVTPYAEESICDVFHKHVCL